jgi:light-regulated signal transduction histidine kinase (bacteriophytochrome)
LETQEEKENKEVWGGTYEEQYFSMFASHGFNYISRYAELYTMCFVDRNMNELEKRITSNMRRVLIGILRDEKLVDRIIFYVNIEGEIKDIKKRTILQIVRAVSRETQEAWSEYKQKMGLP